MPTLSDHIALVKRHQAWRREEDEEFERVEFREKGYPKRLGEALDAVVLAAERCDLVRAETIEDCAKVCEEKHANGNWKHDTRDECALAIRAMK